MRIIAGRYRGKKLPTYPKDDLRPTTDFAKEGLFNVLNNRIELEGIRFLDLFSGTGSISYELISRGAASGIVVDISNSSFKHREKVLRMLDQPKVKNVRADSFRFARNVGDRFDLVFADPPYGLDKLIELPDLILDYGLLKDNGLFVLEHSEEHTFGEHPAFDGHRRYGQVNFSFFKP